MEIKVVPRNPISSVTMQLDKHFLYLMKEVLNGFLMIQKIKKLKLYFN